MDQRLPEPAVTDWRGLCEELANTLERAQKALRFEGGCSDATDNKRRALIDRARAALAAEADGPAVQSREPASVVGEPSDEDLLELAEDWPATTGPRHDLSGCPEVPLYSVFADEVVEFARAVLARYAHQPAPPAEGEQRHPAPVPVSKRLPGPGDCDEEGLCWWFSPADPSAGTFGVAACWVLRKHEPEDDFRTHWLPAHALPLPSGEVQP